jgi:hypothetical protein
MKYGKMNLKETRNNVVFHIVKLRGMVGIAITAMLFFYNNCLFAQIPNWEWCRSPAGNANSRSVTVGPTGNVFICGGFEGSLKLDSTVSLEASKEASNFGDMFIASYDQNGKIAWAKNAYGNYGDEAQCLAISPSGNVYIAGEFWSNTIIFDSITLVNNHITPYFDQALNDIFLAKYNQEGQIVWAKSGGGIQMDFVRGMSIDSKGNVTIVGTFWDTSTTFGPYTLTNTGNIDVFIVQYDSNGQVLWAKNPIGSDEENAYSIAADKEGNVYVVGSFRSNYIQFDQIKLNCSSDKFDTYIVEYDPQGNAIWAENASGSDWDEATGVTIDQIGDIYVTGYFNSDSLQFGSVVLEKSRANNSDMFLVKYDSLHQLVWARHSGGNIWSWVYPDDITVDSYGNIWVAGAFIGNGIEFDSIDLLSNGSYDGYLVKYNASGNVLGAESMGGSYMDWCQGIDSDTSGHIYLTGFFESSSMVLGDTTFQNILYDKKVFLGKKENQTTSALCGDANFDKIVDIGDVVYLINYVFYGGALSIGPSDVNNDDVIDIGDIVYLINYLFYSGTEPACQ